MNQIEQLRSLAAGYTDFLLKGLKTTVRRHNDIINENNGKC